MKEERVIPLPEAFLKRMKALLGEEYPAFVESYGQERVYGLRLNPWKLCPLQEERRLAGWRLRFGLQRIPWVCDGYYYDEPARPGSHPLHDAGVFYIQEPSAMAAVELLEPKPGEWVLDLCAAPGGKTAQIGARMRQSGLLLSNELHPARAKILSQNVERMGIANGVVVNEASGRLRLRFPEFFDKVLVDAPCSGEGMFRKDLQARGEWSEEETAFCAQRQGEILDDAAAMLKVSGRLVYSTCTFSPEENEGSLQRFLDRHPEFRIEEEWVPEGFEGFDSGRPEWIEGGREELLHTFRIWPHKTRGEGHYIAALRKVDGGKTKEGKSRPRGKQRDASARKKEKEAHILLKDFCSCELKETPWIGEPLMMFGEQVYLPPEGRTDWEGLKVLRPGLHLGEVKKNRFEPSHALGLYLKKEQVRRWYELEEEGEEIRAYLRGETLPAAGNFEEGWTLMLVDGKSLGWAKHVKHVLKNHYPKGLRRAGSQPAGRVSPSGGRESAPDAKSR